MIPNISLSALPQSIEQIDKKSVFTILDQGCSTYKESTNEVDKTYLVNICSLKVFEKMASVLDDALIQEETSLGPQNRCREFKRVSEDLTYSTKKSVDDEYPVTPEKSKAILRAIKNALDDPNYTLLDKCYTPKQIVQTLFFHKKIHTIKSEYISLFKDVEMKIENAFKHLFSAECNLIHYLTDRQKQIVQPDSIINFEIIKTKVKYCILAEYISTLSDLSV